MAGAVPGAGVQQGVDRTPVLAFWRGETTQLVRDPWCGRGEEGRPQKLETALPKTLASK